ncbi:GntR family transcriptional regulator [Cetobacterium sp.]|uniref:GntR family transcriptional regulator n=1 Tax=Cetobacterium sp. TaxID=2071632 RepID=UPI003EE4957B
MKKKDFVTEDILSKIYQGYYKIEEKLPTERILALKYGVSRYTVREAIKKLNSIGSLISIQGSGNFVTKSNYGSSLIYNSLTEKRFDEIKSKLIYLKKIKPTKELKEIFNINDDDELWEFKRLRFINYRKIQLEVSKMPVSLFKDLTKEILEGSVHSYVQKKTKKISHFITTYSSVIINKEEADLLSCKKGLSAMKIINRGILKNSKIFEYSELISLEYSCTYISSFNEKGHKSRESIE